MQDEMIATPTPRKTRALDQRQADRSKAVRYPEYQHRELRKGMGEV